METLFKCKGPELRDAVGRLQEIIAQQFGPPAGSLFVDRFEADRENIRNVAITLCMNTNAYQKQKADGATANDLTQTEVKALQTVVYSLNVDPEAREAILVAVQTEDAVGGAQELPVLNCQFPRAQAAPEP